MRILPRIHGSLQSQFWHEWKRKGRSMAKPCGRTSMRWNVNLEVFNTTDSSPRRNMGHRGNDDYLSSRNGLLH